MSDRYYDVQNDKQDDWCTRVIFSIIAFLSVSLTIGKGIYINIFP